jgi:tubulin epsilon
VVPSPDDDVVTSPYNSCLTLDKLSQHADCILPIDNLSLQTICARIDQQSDSPHRVRLGSTLSDTTKMASSMSLGSTRKKNGFAMMNNIAANLLLNMTRYAVPLPGVLLFFSQDGIARCGSRAR